MQGIFISTLVGGIIAGFTGDRLISGWLESSQLHIIGIPNNVSVGKPVNVMFITFGNGESVGITNVNGELVLQLNAPRTGSIVANAKKPDYTDSSVNISSTSQPTLSVSSSLSAVTINVPMYVIFTVTAGGSPVNDVLVSLTGTASGSGITNQEGKAIILVTSSGAGTITASANRIGFTGGSIALTSTGAQGLSVAANPTSVTAGVPAYVTFTVTSAGSALGGATVNVSGGGISTDGVTNSAGQATLLLNAATSGTISVTARKAGYVDGLTTIAH